MEYPAIVKYFFDLFSSFNFEFIPGIIDNDKRYFMKSPNGFNKNSIDSLFIRNSG